MCRAGSCSWRVVFVEMQGKLPRDRATLVSNVGLAVVSLPIFGSLQGSGVRPQAIRMARRWRRKR